MPLLGPFGEEARAGEHGGLRIVVAERVRHLAGMVGPIAGDHRPLASSRKGSRPRLIRDRHSHRCELSRIQRSIIPQA
jgi:hypothetical protein